jgi:hypothetical protein
MIPKKERDEFMASQSSSFVPPHLLMQEGQGMDEFDLGHSLPAQYRPKIQPPGSAI